MASRHRSVRIDDEVWDEIDARPGKTLNDKLRGMLSEGQAEQPKARAPSAAPVSGVAGDLLREVRDAQISLKIKVNNIEIMAEEILDLARSEPVGALVSTPITGGFDPANIPGVHQGLPRRESGQERVEREEREREARARARSTLGDSPDFCVDPQYVQE